MKRFRVVSIDMFRTLADVDHLLKYERWQRLLKDNYSVERAHEYQTLLDSSLTKNFPKDRFVLQMQILQICLAELLSEIPFEFSLSEAKELTVTLHSLSRPFDDSIAFLNQVGKEYQICLASDADEEILGMQRNMYAFDHIFTSEQLHTYKGTADGRFFLPIMA